MRFINKAVYVKDYVIRITFDTNETFEIDFWPILKSSGPIFVPLKDITYFKQFSIDPDFKVLCWPNTADISNEFLYDIAKGKSSA